MNIYFRNNTHVQCYYIPDALFLLATSDVNALTTAPPLFTQG